MDGFLATERSAVEPRLRNKPRHGAYTAFREARRLFAIDEIHLPWNATDVNRYWLLEFRAARGEPPSSLLPIVEGEVNVGSQPQCVWRSLRAELLWRLGRKTDAEAEASRAMEALKIERTVAIIARAHAGVLEERFARIAGGKS